MDVGGAIVVLVLAAGLNGPLALCALVLAVLNNPLLLRPGFEWLATPWLLGAAGMLLVLQLCADLFFVPITVNDARYLAPGRTQNAYVHARMQSLFRPLCAALIGAAALLPVADWLAALMGFCGGAALYWLWAWVREYVARTRGTLVLSALETAKNALLVPLVVVAWSLPFVALAAATALIAPVAWWVLQLQREYRLYARGGGQRASEDA